MSTSLDSFNSSLEELRKTLKAKESAKTSKGGSKHGSRRQSPVPPPVPITNSDDHQQDKSLDQPSTSISAEFLQPTSPSSSKSKSGKISSKTKKRTNEAGGGDDGHGRQQQPVNNIDNRQRGGDLPESDELNQEKRRKRSLTTEYTLETLEDDYSKRSPSVDSKEQRRRRSKLHDRESRPIESRHYEQATPNNNNSSRESLVVTTGMATSSSTSSLPPRPPPLPQTAGSPLPPPPPTSSRKKHDETVGGVTTKKKNRESSSKTDSELPSPTQSSRHNRKSNNTDVEQTSQSEQEENLKRGKRSAGETNNNRRIPPRPPSATPSQSASPTITSNSPRSRSLSTSNALDDAASARKKSSHRPIPPKSPAPVSPAAETITSLPRSLPRSNRDKYGSTSPSHPPPPPPPPRRRSQSLVNYSTSSNSDDLISSTSSSSELIKNGGDGSSYESGQARSRSLARSLPTKKSSKAAKATPSVTTAESTETDVLTEGGKSRLLINNHRTGRAGESDKFEGTNRSSSHDESRESQDGSKGKHDLDESAVKSRKERLRKMSSRAVENDSQSPERGRSREKKKKASAAKERKLAAASAEQLTEKEYAESAAIDSLFEHLDRKASDFDGNVLSIKVHSADSLRPNLNVLHPLVKIHIVDRESGHYIKKSDSKRPATTFHEEVDFILPVMTKPFSFPRNLTVTPRWEEEVVINEDYLELLKDNVIVFFEILDFVTTQKKLVMGQSDGWYRVAWAFLKIVGANKRTNTEKLARLQLYQYPKKIPNHREDDIPYVYKCWWGLTHQKYPSTIYVNLSAKKISKTKHVTKRPNLATEIERGKMTYEELMDEYTTRKNIIDPMMKSLLTMVNKPHWRRLGGQRCKVPNKLMHRIDPGTRGAFCLSFSNNGMYLAIGGITEPTFSSGRNSGHNARNASYPIRVYNVLTGDRVASLEGHQDLVYSVNWSFDDDNLVSSSSDGSVRVWLFLGDGSVRTSAVFQHPSYVYSATIHPTAKSPRLIATGCYDGLIRIWKYDPYKRFATTIELTQDDDNLLHTLHGHHGAVNSICFDGNGTRMYSADGAGIIKIWNANDVMESDCPYEPFQCIKTVDAMQGVPVTCLQMHATNRKMLVHLQGHGIRTFDVRTFRFVTEFHTNNYVRHGGTFEPSKMGVDYSMGLLGRKMGKLARPHPNLDVPLCRSVYSPCGNQVWSGCEDGRVLVWKADTGDIAAIYDDQVCDEIGGVSPTSAIVDVAFHPHDHIVAFCSLGDSQPVLIFTWDEEFPTVESMTTEAIGISLLEDNAVETSLDHINNVVQDILLEKKQKSVNSMLESAAISTKNAKPGTGRNPIDLTPDDESSSARSMKIKMIKAKVKRPLGAYLGEGTHSHIE